MEVEDSKQSGKQLPAQLAEAEDEAKSFAAYVKTRPCPDAFAEQLQADDPGGSIYELSIYYALLALLGNDVPSHSRMFSTCLLVIGSALVAVIFGNMTVLLSNYDAQSRAYQEKLERVKQGLARMEVPSKLQTRVIK